MAHLSFHEVEALPPSQRDAYRLRVAEAASLLAAYEPIGCAFNVLEQGECWGILIKGRTYHGSHFKYESGPGPDAAERKRRAAELRAASKEGRLARRLPPRADGDPPEPSGAA